jgi:hypothetical protein
MSPPGTGSPDAHGPPSGANRVKTCRVPPPFLDLQLVWGFGCQASPRGLISLFLFVSFFVRSGSPRFFVPTHKSQTPSRAGVVKVGRRANVATRSIIARPHLDGPEHDGTLDVVGMTLSRGARLLGARFAPHACIRRVPYDPNHDAVMRIGSEAPRRRTHSFGRHQSHAASRDPATSNRHRRPVARAC